MRVKMQEQEDSWEARAMESTVYDGVKGMECKYLTNSDSIGLSQKGLKK